MSESYRDLRAWKNGMELLAEVYRITESFPRREIYGLTRQLRASALSVPSNIAEGKGRQTKRDYLQFLYRARGSLYEGQTQLEAARMLSFMDERTFEEVLKKAADTGRILKGSSPASKHRSTLRRAWSVERRAKHWITNAFSPKSKRP